jgi:hypothetical protein
MTVVTQARRYHDAGWGERAIVRFFAEDGITVSERTVKRWTDPELVERDAANDRRRKREAAGRRSGRLADHIGARATAEFKLTRMRALKERAGMGCGAIGRVMAFDFGGPPLTASQVRHALAAGRYPEIKS